MLFAGDFFIITAEFFVLMFQMAHNIPTHLHFPIKDNQWPIIYSPEYNITFCGIERLQAYDTCKSGNIFALLKGNCISVTVTLCSIGNLLFVTLLTVCCRNNSFSKLCLVLVKLEEF